MNADDMRRLAGRTGFDVTALEKDYALTWLIHGIYAGSPLSSVLIFKGGTAIRKVYAPEWRLSEDLDFTSAGSATPDDIREGFEAVLKKLNAESPFRFAFSQFHGKPYYVQARVQYDGPLAHKNTVKLDISMDEKLVTEPVKVAQAPEYGVPACDVLIYSLDEILVEKLRSILQRGYARDYYDVWRLLRSRNFDTKSIRELFLRKCELTGVACDMTLIFDKDRLAEAARYWETALARLTQDLPAFEEVIADLKNHLAFLKN